MKNHANSNQLFFYLSDEFINLLQVQEYAKITDFTYLQYPFSFLTRLLFLMISFLLSPSYCY